MRQKSRKINKKPVDLFRANYKRKRKFPIFRLAAVLAIILAVLFLLYKTYDNIVSSLNKGEIFPIKHIYVEGAKHMKIGFIRTVFRGKDGSLLLMNRERIKGRLRQNRWFESAVIYKRFPDTVVIKIAERQPALELFCNKERWLVDKTGYAFKKLFSNSEHYILPHVYSSNCFDLKNNKNLYDKLMFTKKLLERYFTIKRIDIIGKAVYYRLNAGPSVVVSTGQSNYVIGRHVKQLVDFWKNAKKENKIKRISAISFVYKNQIVIRWKVAGYVK